MQILANQTKELNLSPSSYIYHIQPELFKHPQSQTLFLISDVQLLSLMHILKHYCLHTLKPLVSETVLTVTKKHIPCDEPFTIIDASAAGHNAKPSMDTNELDRILERLISGESDDNVYEDIRRCQGFKETSDMLIVNHEAVNKSIISINYSN